MTSVLRSRLVELFHTLGAANAHTWDANTLQQKVRDGRLSKMRDEDTLLNATDQELFDILNTNPADVEVVDDGPAPTANGKAKTKTKAKAKAKAKGKTKASTKKNGNAPGKKPKAKAKPPANGNGPTRKAGVQAAIVDILAKASKSKPLGKNDVLDKVCERFPDRKRESLKNTVHSQIPNRIPKEQGVKVYGGKDDGGYWCDPKEVAKVRDKAKTAAK